MIWLLPLYGWVLLRARAGLQERPLLWSLLVGGLPGWASLFCSYWFYFCGLGLAVWLVVVRAWRVPRMLRRLVWPGVVVGLAMLGVRLSMVPAKTPTLGQGASDMDLLQSWDDLRSPPEGRYSWSTSLDLGGVLSPVLGPRSYRADEAARAEGALYLGWIPLLATLVALRRRRLARPVLLVAIGLGGLVLAAGPYVRYGNQALGEEAYSGDAGVAWPLPHLLLVKVVPGLAEMNHPYRFGVFPSFVLALGLGAAVAGRRRWAVLVTLAAIGEHAWATGDLLPFSPTDPELPTVLGELPEPDGRPTVLLVPGSPLGWSEGGFEWDRWSLVAQIVAVERPLATPGLLANADTSVEDWRVAADAATVGAVVVRTEPGDFGPLVAVVPDGVVEAMERQVGRTQRALAGLGAERVTVEQGLEVWRIDLPVRDTVGADVKASGVEARALQAVPNRPPPPPEPGHRNLRSTASRVHFVVERRARKPLAGRMRRLTGHLELDEHGTPTRIEVEADVRGLVAGSAGVAEQLRAALPAGAAAARFQSRVVEEVEGELVVEGELSVGQHAARVRAPIQLSVDGSASVQGELVVPLEDLGLALPDELGVASSVEVAFELAFRL